MGKTIDSEYVVAAARIAGLPLSAGEVASVTAQLQRVEEIAQSMLAVSLEREDEAGRSWRP
jgi:Asp-tRNA(Asn)/Glu-tRNA(Gln) amidotransferase C subunit